MHHSACESRSASIFDESERIEINDPTAHGEIRERISTVKIRLLLARIQPTRKKSTSLIGEQHERVSRRESLWYTRTSRCQLIETKTQKEPRNWSLRIDYNIQNYIMETHTNIKRLAVNHATSIIKRNSFFHFNKKYIYLCLDITRR